MASKFLTVKESVRDAADLYLSLRYPPPVFICDTPCGFVRHLDVRNKNVASKLWGKNSGCFEVPTMGRSPKEVLCLLTIHVYAKLAIYRLFSGELIIGRNFAFQNGLPLTIKTA